MEMTQRQKECPAQADTVYIGGGTPSQLSAQQLHQLFRHLGNTYDISAQAEITMECNPDDITEAFAATLSALPVNRVSMGVQTFDDHRLRFLRRRHTAAQIPIAVERLREAGIRNISVDLMFAFPNETIADWHHDIEAAVALDVEHLSAYSLMYEEGTVLHTLLEQGQVGEADEEVARQMFSDLMDRLADAGYEHYEISNFAKHTFRSRHNSSYWQGVPYLGLGAAAHSYDGRHRRWNIDDVEQYIEGIENGCPVVGAETLDDDTRYNEQIMTALRTFEGLALDRLQESYRDYCLSQARPFIDDRLLTLQAGRLRLSRRGIFVSNMIMSSLMMTD